jgi:hypothetical protein
VTLVAGAWIGLTVLLRSDELIEKFALVVGPVPVDEVSDVERSYGIPFTFLQTREPPTMEALLLKDFAAERPIRDWQVNAGALALDLFVMLLLLAGAWLASEWLIRRRAARQRDGAL